MVTSPKCCACSHYLNHDPDSFETVLKQVKSDRDVRKITLTDIQNTRNLIDIIENSLLKHQDDRDLETSLRFWKDHLQSDLTTMDNLDNADCSPNHITVPMTSA